jgi:beta-glucosidase
MKLGMFDPEEMVPYTGISYDVVDSEPHRKMALDAARKSMVLLKNKDNLLPFSKDLGQVAVIGPNANRQGVLLANYNGYPSASITPLEGIREKLSASNVVYAPGARLADEFPLMDVIPSDYLFVSKDLQKKGLRAEYYNNPELKGEASIVKTDSIIDFVWWNNAPEEGLEYDNFSVRWTGYLVPPVSGEYAIGGEGYRAFKVVLDDEVMGEWDVVHHPHMEYEKVELEANQAYKIVVEYRQWEIEYPNMKLLWDMPGRELEKEALALARESDAIVMCMGLSPFLEGEEMKVKVDGFAGGDRVDIGLPASQSRLIKEIMKLNKPTVLVLLNGSALAINWEAENVPAILEAWYPGQAAGTAIADVLFGDYNPAGRLPLTFYKSVDDLPPFEEYGMEGRTYKYFDGEPLYAFGHGLSYTTFGYSNLEFSDEYVAKDNLNLSITVSNDGEYDGEEVVQVYASYPGHEGAPQNILCGFKRVFLKEGEKRTVKFSISPEDFAVYDPEKQMSVPLGDMQFSVGGHQPDAESVSNGQVLVADVQVIDN